MRGICDVHRAAIFAVNTEVDIAIIKAEGGTFPFIELLAENESIEIGEEIDILGYPFGSKLGDDVEDLQISLTRGFVSSRQKRNGKTVYYIDIAARAGNSGSPVTSRESGKVVGVLCGSIVNGREEINYMCPITYFWKELTD